MNIQNLQQKNSTLLAVNQKVYSHENQIKFLTSLLQSSLCDYSHVYILVTGNITSSDNNAKAAFRNCWPFRKCKTEINESFVDEAKHINIAMPM